MSARSNKTKWFITGAVVVLLLGAFGVAALLFTACTSNKYIVAAGLPNPDSGFQTGTITGYDVWIWECYQNKRIVLWRTSAEMSAGPYTRQEAPCGEQTPIEIQLANERKRERAPHAFW